MTKRQLFETNALILHSVIKAEIDSSNLSPFIKQMSHRLPVLITSKLCYCHNISYVSIDKLAKKIIRLDSEGVLVYSCLSLSILIHIYLCCANISSKVIIGSCMVENKVFSHAWVEAENGEIFDYRYDMYNYKIIKTIDIMGEHS